jgi:hypothetical protein
MTLNSGPKMPSKPQFTECIGAHPAPPNPLGVRFSHADGHSAHGVPTRALSESGSDLDQFARVMRTWIRDHHAHPEDLARDAARREALARQGFRLEKSRFPSDPNTQKGNWTEIFLCEYVKATCQAGIPVYRLRCNPNIEQSMKGDDVLAFDLNADPVRIIVGEAKFRASSSRAAVEQIVEALERSHRGGLPASLQFVADRLFREGNEDLGRRIEECTDLFVRDRLRIDHLGLLASNHLAPTHVASHAQSSAPRLAVMSLKLADGAGLVASSFDSLEAEQ